MLLAYLAVGWRAVSGRYAVFWLGLLGLFTVLPKFWMSPDGPIYWDETAHFALLRNVISAGRLFQHTPLLPIGTLLPRAGERRSHDPLADRPSPVGLGPDPDCRGALPASGTGLLHSASPAEFPIGGRRSAAWSMPPIRVSCIGDVQFAYESVAILLMLTIVRLYAEALAAERSGGRTWRQSLATALLIAVISFGCVVTHHLTSLTGVALLLAGALILKPISGLADRKGGWRRLFVRWMPVLTLATCLGLWVAFVAPATVSYLFPSLSGTASQLVALATGSTGSSGAARMIFNHSTAPGYERVAAVAAPVMIAVAFLLAGIRWLRKPPLRSNFLWPFVLVMAYLVSLPLTLVSNAVNGAHRSWAFTFVGIALLPAAVVILFELDKRRRWLKRTAATAGAAVLAVLLVGNVAAGTPIDYRFPGPYKFGSDTLSVTPETLSFAHWVRARLGPGAHVVTDRFTALALTAHADAVTPIQGPGWSIASIWYNRRPPTPFLMSALERQRDDYLAIDVRDAQHTAIEPPLFYTGEPKLVPLQNITRLGQWPWLRLLYSSPHYRLYKIDYHSYYLWYPSHANDH